MTLPVGHAVQVRGEGFFSSATCTACDWEEKGPAAELPIRWVQYHAGMTESGEIRPMEAIPEPTGDAYMRDLETQIIHMVCAHLKYAPAKLNREALYAATGLALARSLYIKQGGGWTAEEKSSFVMDPQDYVARIVARVAHLHPRQQDKLRHPARDRREQQILLEGGNL